MSSDTESSADDEHYSDNRPITSSTIDHCDTTKVVIECTSTTFKEPCNSDIKHKEHKIQYGLRRFSSSNSNFNSSKQSRTTTTQKRQPKITGEFTQKTFNIFFF